MGRLLALEKEATKKKGIPLQSTFKKKAEARDSVIFDAASRTFIFCHL